MDTLRHALLWGALLLAGPGCTFNVDPDQGLFSCAEDPDCGPDFECRPQAAGGGLCYREGECGTETCDGLDHDCDGAVDCADADCEGHPCLGGTCTQGVCR